MRVRIIWAIIMLAIALPFIFLVNDVIFFIGVTFVSLLAMHELLSAKGNIPFLVRFFSYLAMIFTGYYSYSIGMIESHFFMIIFIVILVLVVIHNNLNKFNFNDAAACIVMTYYLMFSFNALIFIHQNFNLYVFLYPILVAVLADTFGYFGGMVFGKHNFSKISPTKTVEGFVVASLVAGVFSYVYLHFLDYDNLHAIIISIIMVILSQCGDLVASAIKRTYNIKDYSNLIPGHGGIVDRFDSILFNFIIFKVLLIFI